MSTVKDSLNELLVDVFNYILNIEEQAIKEMGVRLSMSEIHVIEAIHNVQPPTVTNVSNKLLITPGTLSISIDRLVNKGYVQRYQEGNDRRKVFLRLTQKGEEAKRAHDLFHEELIEKVIKDMKIEEKGELLIALENLQTYFKDQYNQKMKS